MAGREDEPTPRFETGQTIRHRVWGYRGVILDVHERFQGSEEWYWMQSVSANQVPPKDEPWYEVRVRDSRTHTYVAEQNLEPELGDEALQHSSVGSLSGQSKGGGMIN